MTSLGSYGTASVLECETLVCNKLKSNNGIVTSVYGQLKLPNNETISNANPQPIKTWINDPSSAVQGVSVDNTTGHISVSETGLYLLLQNTQFQTSSAASQSQARLMVNRFSGATETRFVARFLANSAMNVEISLSINYLLKVDDIRDTFEIDVFNAGPNPKVLDDGTFIQLVKIL